MRIFMFLLLSLLCTFFCQGQDEKIPFSISTLTPDDGLSQGSNYFRYEDSKGFMWITGNDALNRYDGSMVKVYNLNRYFKDCPNLQQGYGFAEDDKSNVYIGSVRGLYKYTRNKDQFSLIKIFSNAADDIAMPICFSKGKIWCFNRLYQLATYDIASGAVDYITKLDIPAVTAIHIYQIASNPFYFRWPFLDNNNNIWITGEKKVIRYNILNKQVDSPLERSQDKKTLTYFSTAYDEKDNTILLGTDRGIVKYSIAEDRSIVVASIGEENIRSISQLAIGKDYYAIKNNGASLFLSDKKMQRLKIIEKPLKSFFSLFGLGFDKADRLWFCLDGQGQVILNFSSPLLPKITVDEYGLNGVGGFAEFTTGNILLSGGMIYSPATKKIDPLLKNLTLTSRGVSDWNRKGIWLLSVNNKGQQTLLFISSDKKIVLKYTNSNRTIMGEQQDVFVTDKSNILCSFSNGLYWYDDIKGEMQKVNNQPYPNSFKINNLSGHRIAISYLNNDMWMVETKGDTALRFIKKILPGVQSFYMQEDEKRKQYWVGTNNGVYLLNENMDLIKKFDANTGLAGTYIYGLLLDDEGNAWCSHQRGLSSINANTNKIINYSKEDGIQDWDYNNRAFLKARDGTLYFGGVNGFNYFKPPLQSSGYYRPTAYIDAILVNDEYYLPDTNANMISFLKLKAFQNNISIRASINDLQATGNQQLRYRINNGQWMAAADGKINFAKLSPGNYSMDLATYNKFSDKVEINRTLKVEISSPFYQRTWFWVLLSVMMTAFIFLLITQNKKANLLRKIKEQAALEQQRNKITADLHDDIGASLSSLQLNSAVANQLINKDVEQTRSMLKKIERQAQNLSEKMGDFIWSMKPGKDEFMTLSSRIKTFANEILGATDINYEIKIDTAADTEIKDITVRKNIVLITKEGINNAVKYSKALNVLVSLKKENGKFVLIIKDDGIGYKSENATGNGISNMRKRAAEIHGSFGIDTVVGKGTMITVHVG